MSCHSTPGNRAVIAVARHTASAECGKEVTEAQAQRAFHSLLSEGRRIDAPAPDRVDVARWFHEQEFAAALDIPAGRSREAALRNLAEARAAWQSRSGVMNGATFHAWRFTPDLTAYTAGRARHPDPLTIAFDCDGVLYDFNGTIREWLAARGWDRRRMPDPAVYNLSQAWGLSQEELHREMPLAIQAGILWHTGQPLRDGTRMARRLGQAGHTIMVNTARALPGIERQAERATLTWLRSVGVHPDRLHLADPFDARDKLRADFDVLLDDHVGNVAVARAAGRHAVLISRGWNVGHADQGPVHFHQVPAIIEGIRTPIPQG